MTDLINADVEAQENETPEVEEEIGEGTGEETPPKDDTPADSSYSKNVQARINVLTKQRTQAETGKLEAESKLAEYEAREKAGPRPIPPDPNNFQDEAGVIDSSKYQTQLSTYEDKLHEWRQTQTSTPDKPPESNAADLEQAHKEFSTRAESLRAANPDFDEVTNREVFTDEMRDVMFSSDVGPQMAYYLGSNEEEAMRIGNLPHDEMLMELGAIQGRIKAPPNKREISEAPEPLNTLHGNAPAEKDPEKMSTDEWMEHEKKRQIKKMGLSP